MKTLSSCHPAGGPETAHRSANDGRSCTLIIMVESGVVTDILPTGPVDAVVVDLDMIENGDSFEQRMRKSVLPLAPEGRITLDSMPSLITSIVREYRRPERRRTGCTPGETEAA